MSVVIFSSSDSTLTVENVAAVMALMKPEWLEKMITKKLHCGAYMSEFGNQSTAVAWCYIHCFRYQSLRDLAEDLFDDEDTPLPALEKLRQFLPPIGIV